MMWVEQRRHSAVSSQAALVGCEHGITLCRLHPVHEKDSAMRPAWQKCGGCVTAVSRISKLDRATDCPGRYFQ